MAGDLGEVRSVIGGFQGTSDLIQSSDERSNPKGVKLDEKSMKPCEKCLQRLADLSKWFIRISSVTATAMLSIMAI